MEVSSFSLIEFVYTFSMTSFFIHLSAFEKLNDYNYQTWKFNLDTILTIGDLKFVLKEECPLIPAHQ